MPGRFKCGADSPPRLEKGKASIYANAHGPSYYVYELPDCVRARPWHVLALLYGVLARDDAQPAGDGAPRLRDAMPRSCDVRSLNVSPCDFSPILARNARSF